MDQVAIMASQGRGDERAGQGGISITELIVGFQVFLILALTSMPALSRVLQTYRVRGAAHEILADLETARMGAVMANHHYRFLVVDTHTFQVHDDTNSNDIVDPGETVMTRNIQTDNPGVQIVTGSNNITFVANGTAPTNGTITLSNENASADRATVVVTWGGRIRIQ